MKTVMITGASRGIGREIALKLGNEGYNVVINYNKSEKEALELLEELSKITGAIAIKADVSKYDEVVKMVEEARKRFGNITHLVCNAGISVAGTLLDNEICQCDNLIDTNLKGVIYTVKEVLPDMLSKHFGAIVNISSIWGKTGASCEAVYSASKAGVIAFSEGMAKEVGPSGIRVNAVCPGVIDTDMMKNYTDEEKVELKNSTSLMRLGTPNDIANVVSFLLSDDASFITGQSIVVDGGFI